MLCHKLYATTFLLNKYCSIVIIFRIFSKLNDLTHRKGSYAEVSFTFQHQHIIQVAYMFKCSFLLLLFHVEH